MPHYSRLRMIVIDLPADDQRQVQDWYVMRDPAGLLFCVVPVKAGSLDDNNAQRWD